jgi:hypothetical protein
LQKHFYSLTQKLPIMAESSKGRGGSRGGNQSEKGLASASEKTKKEVAKKGGEASRGGGRSSGSGSEGGRSNSRGGGRQE